MKIKRTAKLLLFVFACGILSAQAESPKNKPDDNWSRVWTIVMDRPGFVVTLRVTAGHMVVWSNKGIDWKNDMMHRNSVELEWHYPSGEPWYEWIDKQLPDKNMNRYSKQALPYWEKAKPVTAEVYTLGRDKDKAAISKKVYFEMDFRRHPHKFKDQGLLWKGAVHKYTWEDRTYYLIEKRTVDDASLITCSESAFYCRIRGARLNDYLVVDDILVPKNDLANWRKYQELVKSKVKKMFVSVNAREGV